MQLEESYLTENKLGEFLLRYIPSGNWVSQYKLSNSRFKVDWASSTLGLCVEFDGYQHYTSSKQILNDRRKDALISDMGFKSIRIPYFIQLNREVIKDLFNVDIPEFVQTYPHGFVSTKNTMAFPADFCYMGIERFASDLERFHYVKDSIVDSLRSKKLPKELLLPKPLVNLLDDGAT